jgi:hypothetical protein
LLRAWRRSAECPLVESAGAEFCHTVTLLDDAETCEFLVAVTVGFMVMGAHAPARTFAFAAALAIGVFGEILEVVEAVDH